MANTKGCIKHAAQAKIFKLSKRIELVVHVILALLNIKSLLAPQERAGSPVLISPDRKVVDALMCGEL